MRERKSLLGLVSVMLCFFVMGFVDLVGIASNYVKEDLQLSDSVANVLPSLVFFWFLFFSIPTSMLMNRIGRKKTVLVSLGVTVLALCLPLLGDTFPIMLAAFSLLGIGNAIMQTSLNPLTMVVAGSVNFASTLTFGQFVKAIASFLAPFLASWGATWLLPQSGLGWRMLFAVYLVVCILSTVLLWSVRIKEQPTEEHVTSLASTMRLFGNPVVLLSFLCIVCHVGIHVGTNTTAPKLLMERLGLDLCEAGFATSLYFVFRTTGCLTGSFLLYSLRTRTFFLISVLMLAASMLGMCFAKESWMLYAAIALAGYGNSNIFPICFAHAVQSVPGKQNEVSGLMIMGLFGGAVFPLLMGLASDATGQAGAVGVMMLGVVYLLTYTNRLK